MKALSALALIVTVFASCQKVPEANISSNKSVAETGEEIYFQNETSNGHSYRWEFGDGTYSTEKNPVKAYDTAGSFQIKMTAFSKNDKKEDEAAMNVVVKNANDKFIGFYDSDICNNSGMVHIGPGPSANEVVIDVDGFIAGGSVSGQALIIPRKEESQEGEYKLAYSGSGNIVGNSLTMMWKIEMYDEESKNWFPIDYCSIKGTKKL